MNRLIFWLVMVFSFFIQSLCDNLLSAQMTSYYFSDSLNIEENIITQLEVFPQEKLHLHTDRDFYVPGEKIWFKAYVVDAHSHLHPTYSQFLYVELISPLDTLVCRVMIQQKDDMFFGHLPLRKIIPEGNYTLRAYTRYMENLGDDYFFKKNIRIGNLSSVKTQPATSDSRRRQTQIELDDFDVSFFPEGGNLLEGIFCKVAFKAMNKNGYSETVYGKLVDETGVELALVNTYYAGMGIIGFIPEANKRIYLKCKNENGFEKQFELPQPVSLAYSLSASLRGNRFLISVQKSIHAPDIPLYLLAHCRGEVLYCLEWDNNRSFISFQQEQLPTGVIQFLLFDSQMNTLSERLVFNKNDDVVAQVEFRTDKVIYEKREKVISTLSLYELSDFAHFSVAIIDDKDLSVDSTTTILTTLLLSSELKGYIENPAYYLEDNNESATALDYLMLTHGWKRYNVPEVVKGLYKYPHIPFQTDQRITGKVTSLLSDNPVADSEIILMTKDEGVRFTTTDENGLFVFKDFDIPDSASFFLQAFNRKGRSIMLKLNVDQELFPELVYAKHSLIYKIPAIKTKTETVVDVFLEKAEKRAMYDDDIRIIHLEEVVISATRKSIKRDDPSLLFYANQSSDATISRDVIEKNARTYVSDYLWFVGGVYVNIDGSIRIRGGNGKPLVFIDGIEKYWPEKLSHPSQSPLEFVPISMIERIDVFKGFGATMFGMSGANGAISITTKRGEGVPPKEKSYHDVLALLGYQKPVEFYSPKYETLEAKYSTIPDYRTTIFWKPDLFISEEKKEASFEFYTSDFSTTYSVVIEGITADGRIVRQVEKIKVE